MGNGLWSAGASGALLLLLATHLALSEQKDTPVPPPSKEAAEGQRALEGLKKAKPIPDPSPPVARKPAAPSGGLQGFDPKTGNVTAKPANSKAAARATGYKKGKAAAHPKKATARKPQN